MARFLDRLSITELTDDGHSLFQVIDHPFRYQSDVVGLIVVPLLFQTDFASVPRWLGIIYAALGDMAHEPAVVHDFLYYTALFSKEVADKVFLEAMGVINVPWWKRYAIYGGVVMGGFVAWDYHRNRGHSMATLPR